MKEIKKNHYIDTVIYSIDRILKSLKNELKEKFDSLNTGITSEQFVVLDTISCFDNIYQQKLSEIIMKDKDENVSNFSYGLFGYPVLMTADILTFNSHLVPVGIDQKQHVELTRDIAIRFNKKYGNTFKIPEPMVTEVGTKIMDLVDPSKKMSKTEENPKGVIGLLDDINVVRKKIMSATTDSEMAVVYDPENKPGISNLINIYASLTGLSISEIENKFKNANYGEFKKNVADVVCELLEKIQSRYRELVDSKELDEILSSGANQVRNMAHQKFDIMKKKIGLYR